MSKLPIAALLLATVPALTLAADRAIPLSPVVSMSWGYVTPGTTVNPHRLPAVGFWQRSSGAKQGVGAVFVATMEYQLPETPASHVRSAMFQFSGRQSQCSGAEPVVIDVYAYPANGSGEVADAGAGTRVAQLRADCATNLAFNQPIDVTAIVRQLAVPAGIRHVGFNMRKANNRQGPGLFNLSAGKLTVVLADQALAQTLTAAAPPMPGAAPAQTVLSESFEAPASGNHTVCARVNRSRRRPVPGQSRPEASISSTPMSAKKPLLSRGRRRSISPARRGPECCRHVLPRRQARTIS